MQSPKPSETVRKQYWPCQGGRTARALLPHVFEQPLAWDRIVITLTHERWVPASHADSNEGLVRSLLKAPAAVAPVFGLFRHDMMPEQALSDLVARAPAPDVILLGMGEDGHVASIFPQDAANRATAMLTSVNRPDHWRLTLTPVALRRAHRVVLVVPGAAKQAIIEQALRDGPRDILPVRHALAAGATVLIGPEIKA